MRNSQEIQIPWDKMEKRMKNLCWKEKEKDRVWDIEKERDKKRDIEREGVN